MSVMTYKLAVTAEDEIGMYHIVITAINKSDCQMAGILQTIEMLLEKEFGSEDESMCELAAAIGVEIESETEYEDENRMGFRRNR